MKQREICSFEDLYQALKDGWNERLLFRGEDSATYELRPKYGRLQKADKRNDRNVEINLLNEFKRRAIPMLQRTPEDDWEWLGVAQHFGLATRLLDWTENPLIATFFATKWHSEECDRVLYALPENQFSDADIATSPFDIKDIVLYRPKHISSRISAQGGVFTVHPLPSDPLNDERIKRWVIRKDCVIEINVTLMTYGINEAFVFQDMEALARYLNLTSTWEGISLSRG